MNESSFVELSSISDLHSVSCNNAYYCSVNNSGNLQCHENLSGYTGQIESNLNFLNVNYGGGSEACGITANEELICWGRHSLVEYDFANKPYKQVSLGNEHLCALDEDGHIDCFGYDGMGQVSGVPTTGEFIQISSGNYFTCALEDTGQVHCWGYIGYSLGSYASTPTEGIFVQISSGYENVCAIDVLGEVHCWGSNSDDQITSQPECLAPLGFDKVCD